MTTVLQDMFNSAVKDTNASTELFDLLWAERQSLTPEEQTELLELPHLPTHVTQAALACDNRGIRLTALRRQDVDALAVLRHEPLEELIALSQLDPFPTLPELVRRFRARPTRRLAEVLALRSSIVEWDIGMAARVVALLGGRHVDSDEHSDTAADVVRFLGRDGVELVLPKLKDLRVLGRIAECDVTDEVRVEVVRRALPRLLRAVRPSESVRWVSRRSAEQLIGAAYGHAGDRARRRIEMLLTPHRELLVIARQSRHMRLAKPVAWDVPCKPQLGTAWPRTRPDVTAATALMTPGLRPGRRHQLARRLRPQSVAPFDVDVLYPGDEVMAKIWLDLYPGHQIRRHGLQVLGDEDATVSALTRWINTPDGMASDALGAAVQVGIPVGVLRRLPTTLDRKHSRGPHPALTFLLAELNEHAGAWALYGQLRPSFQGTFGELITTCLDATR